MNSKSATTFTIAWIFTILCWTGHAAADDDGTAAPAEPAAVMSHAKTAEAAAQAKREAEVQKYHLHVPTNDSEQKQLDQACADGPPAFYAWLGGPAYVKDHKDIVTSTWPQFGQTQADNHIVCKMVQMMMAFDIKKTTGKSAGLDYLRSSDSEAAKAITIQERIQKQQAQMP